MNLSQTENLLRDCFVDEENRVSIVIRDAIDFIWSRWSWIVTYLGLASSRIGNFLSQPLKSGLLFKLSTELLSDGFYGLLWNSAAIVEYICCYVSIPLATAVGSLCWGYGFCICSAVPSIIQKAVTSLAFVVLATAIFKFVGSLDQKSKLATAIFKFVGSLDQKSKPNALVILFSAVTYQTGLISNLTLLALYELAEVVFLDNVDSLQANPWWAAFLIIFWWKAIKIIVHTYSYVFLTERNLYRPSLNPKFSTIDVTVIVPTVGDMGSDFKRCIRSILANSPARIILTTAGSKKMKKAEKVCEELEEGLHARDRKIIVTSISEPNKRSQFVNAVTKVASPITCYADDHVFWPPKFLKHALAPFEDPLVGLVGTVKRVERIRSGTFWDRLLNYIAVIYLERHNFECTASYNIDGGVFVISGRTALTRTEIMHDVEFRRGYLSETWWWGQVGPMKVDDDNYITRFMVNHGYKTVFHNDPAALMETTLGIEGGVEKFSGQLIRWVRTTWRSNSTSLFTERKVWRAHFWTTFAMMISLCFNISLIYDPLLFFTLYKSGYLNEYWCDLAFFLVVSKTVKQFPHLYRNKDDIWPFWILGMLFGYVHSIFKIWAFFTAKNIEWSGRKGIESVGRPASDRSLSDDQLVSKKNWSIQFRE